MSELFQPPLQSEIKLGNGSPEGVEFAQLGTLYTDATAVELWQKSTKRSLSTGWVRLAKLSELPPAEPATIPLGESIYFSPTHKFYIRIIDEATLYYEVIGIMVDGIPQLFVSDVGYVTPP